MIGLALAEVLDSRVGLGLLTNLTQPTRVASMIERIKWLVNDGVFENLDFMDFDSCVDCIKDNKPTRQRMVQGGVLTC